MRRAWSSTRRSGTSQRRCATISPVKDCNKSPSCFDFDKLKDLNAHYIRQCDPDRLLALVLKLFPDVEPHKEKIAMAVDMLKPRAKTLVEYRWPREPGPAARF